MMTQLSFNGYDYDDQLDHVQDIADTQGEGTNAGDQLQSDSPEHIGRLPQGRDPQPASAINDISRLPGAGDLATDEASAQADSEEKSIDSLVKKAITECLASDKINNPTEILRYLQTLVITGRQLEITDKAESLEGETNFIMIKRGDILKTAFDELKDCQPEELRKTLEVKFHGERGQDNGGPHKEFFVLALRAIKEKYFDDGLNHSCANDCNQMVGIIMSLSMLQNGPLPQFMRESTLEALFFDEESTISPCLKQLRNGLSELGIYQMARKFPTFLHLLRKKPASELSLKRLVKLFEPHFSELGTNKRKHEEDVYGSLVKYFREVARGKRNSGMISLGDILQFVTGTNVEPVLGFVMEPSLLFVDVDTKLGFYPTANTCINCMHLPIPTSTTPLPSEEILFNVYDYSFSNFCFSNV